MLSAPGVDLTTHLGGSVVPVYPGFKIRWNYLETQRCVRDSDNGNFSGEELVSHSELSDTRAKWT
jgi:hypothetical protein